METQITLARKIPGAKIMVETVSGDVMILNHKFAGRDCQALLNTLANVRAAGRIDARYWRPARKGEW